MKRNLLLDALKVYQAQNVAEAGPVAEIVAFIKENPNCFNRSNQSGHITGSAWLISPDGTKVLLTHHKKLNKWLQLGGHSDGDSDTWHVALREAVEESGITDISFVSKEIFDVDVHTIPANQTAGTPAHKHYDIRFLLKAACEDFIVSEESFALKWATLADLETMLTTQELTGGMRRMIAKWRKILAKRA